MRPRARAGGVGRLTPIGGEDPARGCGGVRGLRRPRVVGAALSHALPLGRCADERDVVQGCINAFFPGGSGRGALTELRQELIASRLAPATWRAYGRTWKKMWTFYAPRLRHRGAATVAALHADDEVFYSFFAELRRRPGLGKSVIGHHLAVANLAFDIHELPSKADRALSKLLNKENKRLRTAPTRKRAPMHPREVAVCAAWLRATGQEWHAAVACMMSLSFDLALRYSDVAMLRVGSI